jgi:hypothetical protein
MNEPSTAKTNGLLSLELCRGGFATGDLTLRTMWRNSPRLSKESRESMEYLKWLRERPVRSWVGDFRESNHRRENEGVALLDRLVSP